MHPSKATGFEWDEGNENELAPHHIAADEVEQVFWQGRPLWARNKKGAAGDWLMVGLTLGGRLLTIVVQVNDEDATLRPVTGWEATAGQRKQYFAKGRH